MQDCSGFGVPIVKDGCGIFGVIRKKHAPQISNLAAVNGISCIKYRGSSLGAGFASFGDSGATRESERPYKIKAFVRNDSVAKDIEDQLTTYLGTIENVQLTLPEEDRARLGIWEANLGR